mmetsp:Transcript_71603/g.221428  ORF Transcript_71603/g.221428 Transcript_71603/m.221428 type:complete len:253 (+) Transcript_71603:617-1375(+)
MLEDASCASSAPTQRAPDRARRRWHAPRPPSQRGPEANTARNQCSDNRCSGGQRCSRQGPSPVERTPRAVPCKLLAPASQPGQRSAPAPRQASAWGSAAPAPSLPANTGRTQSSGNGCKHGQARSSSGPGPAPRTPRGIQHRGCAEESAGPAVRGSALGPPAAAAERAWSWRPAPQSPHRTSVRCLCKASLSLAFRWFPMRRGALRVSRRGRPRSQSTTRRPGSGALAPPKCRGERMTANATERRSARPPCL